MGRYSSSSLTFTPRAFASFSIRLSGGSCFPVSRRAMYSRLTPTLSASAAWLSPFASRNAFSLIGNRLLAIVTFQVTESRGSERHHHRQHRRGRPVDRSPPVALDADDNDRADTVADEHRGTVVST